MEDQLKTYYERLGRIDSAREAHIPNAYRVGEDGVLGPVSRPKRRLPSSVRMLLSLMILFALAKGYATWNLGEDYMAAIVEALLVGEPYERLAGFVLTPDPMSDFAAKGYDLLVNGLQWLSEKAESLA